MTAAVPAALIYALRNVCESKKEENAMKKMLALACSLGLAASLMTGCNSKTEDVAASTAASAATEAAKTGSRLRHHDCPDNHGLH